jgi:uncharacterized protein HemX
MGTTGWIIVVVVVLVAVALAAWLVTQQRKKKQHQHAEHLREEAQAHASEIPEAQVRAQETAAQAERARVEAERAQQQAREAEVAATQQQAVTEDKLRTADAVDPRVDTSSMDYTPGDDTGASTDRADGSARHRADGGETPRS